MSEVPLIHPAALQLVAAGAEGARRRRPQARDIRIGFKTGIDQVLGQRADDAVATGEHLADALGVTARLLDQAARRRIDDGGNATGLCIERVPDRHGLLQRLEDAGGDPVNTADTGNFPDLRRAGVAGG